MSVKELNEACAKNNFAGMLQLCAKNKSDNFGYLLSTLLLRNRIGKEQANDDLARAQQFFRQALQKKENLIRVQLLCNWMASEELMKLWAKMLHPESNLVFVNQQPHLWVILNAPPPDASYDPKRAVVFQMEPRMVDTPSWGEWSSPDPSKFLGVFTHQNSINTMEWHLSLTCQQLLTQSIEKSEDICLSTVLSGKYNDEGHRKRVDFIKYIENHLPVHVYGENAFQYKNYKGSLPYHQKDNGLLPYKYTFNAENQSIPNYCTEKIVDAILSECLCFYWGCPNLETILDERCFIRLSLSDFEHDLSIIQKAIEDDEWSKRIPIIRQEKKRILNDLQFTTRLEKMIQRK